MEEISRFEVGIFHEPTNKRASFFDLCSSRALDDDSSGNIEKKGIDLDSRANEKVDQRDE